MKCHFMVQIVDSSSLVRLADQVLAAAAIGMSFSFSWVSWYACVTASWWFCVTVAIFSYIVLARIDIRY